MPDMSTKYGAGPFDPENEADAVCEAFRVAVVGAVLDVLDRYPNALAHHALGGLMVGVVNSVMGLIERSDKNDAAIRSSMLELVPWAVDQARSMTGLPPLADGQ
jgi:hypothetical protein